MKVRYVGESSTGVEVVHPDPRVPDANTVTVCPPGEPVDLPDDIALQQMAVGLFEPGDDDAATALRQHETDQQFAPVTRPSPGAAKPAWAAYAVAQGWTPEAADAATKAELIADLTDPDPSPDADGTTEES